MHRKRGLMNQDIMNKAHRWIETSYFDEADREEIKSLLEQNNENELTERFYKDLEFGTAGLRSIMGMGDNRINKYTIRKATQAMAETILKYKLDKKVCVSYDSRNNSQFFAHEVCRVFAANEIQTYIYRELTPVPMLSFAVRYHQASAGVMITASHNPIEYNGFKAFWSDGAQITPPYDKDIINVYQNLNNWEQIKAMPFDDALEKGLVKYNSQEVVQSYYQAIKDRILIPELLKEKGSLLRVIYTPIHGTGKKPCLELAQEIGLTQFSLLQSQAEPDGNFPTVKSPNPEYPEALKLAVEEMLKTNAHLALGTDPDTDRLGVAVNVNSEITYLTGNQIAALFLYYQLELRQKKNLLKKNSLILKSIVTSEIQDEMAKHYNIQVENTLTGFKWMANNLKNKEDKGLDFDFIFASEESYGFMGHSDVRDKDGVCAVIQMCELTLFFLNQDKNLIQVLDEIYEKFGLFYDNVLSLNFEGRAGIDKILRIMDKLRKREMTSVCEQRLIKISDYQNLITYDIAQNQESTFEFEKSNLLCLEFDNGIKFYARPSGTEPKIKFYFMLKFTEGDLEARKEKAQKLNQELQNELEKFCEKA